MKPFLRNSFLFLGVIVLFFFLFSVDVSFVDDYKKVRVTFKLSSGGVVLRLKPEGWELWKLSHKVESPRIFKKEFDFINKYLLRISAKD